MATIYINPILTKKSDLLLIIRIKYTVTNKFKGSADRNPTVLSDWTVLSDLSSTVGFWLAEPLNFLYTVFYEFLNFYKIF